MDVNFKLVFIPYSENPTTSAKKQARQAADWFAEWCGEGGLQEAINPALYQALGLEVYGTGSGPDMFQLSVAVVPTKAKPR